MASKSTRPAEELNVVMTLEGHEQLVPFDKDRYFQYPVPISYVPGNEQMISGSGDKTARKWDLKTGKEINEARVVCQKEVSAVAVSRDGRWIVTAGGNRIPNNPADGELKAWEIKTGIMKSFEGHSPTVTCIDISADSKLLASGSADEIIRIWDLDIGKLVAGPFQTAQWVGTVRFSQDSMKLAVNSLIGRCLEVWDIQGQKLDRKIGKQDGGGQVTYAPVFWTTNDKSIVAAFTFTPPLECAKNIYEFDASTLDIIGVPFEGHTEAVTCLALSFDCALLASASHDNTIKLWAFETRQLLASFDIQYLNALILSPDLRHLAYTTGSDTKIYICNVPPNILASIRSAQDAQSTSSLPNTPLVPLGDLLNSAASRRRAAVHPAPVISFTPLPHRPSPTVHQQQPAFLRTLRKLIPSFYRNALPHVRNDESHDPLDFPAPSSFSLNKSLSAQADTYVQSGVHSGENSRAAGIAQSSATTIKAQLSGWWPTHTSRVPIVDVPFAQGKKRNAAAGAPKGSDDLVLDENFDSRPPSPIPNSQLPSAVAQTNTGVHGSSWSCFCL